MQVADDTVVIDFTEAKLFYARKVASGSTISVEESFSSDSCPSENTIYLERKEKLNNHKDEVALGAIFRNGWHTQKVS